MSTPGQGGDRGGPVAMLAAFTGLIVAVAVNGTWWWPRAAILAVAGFAYLYGLSSFGVGEEARPRRRKRNTRRPPPGRGGDLTWAPAIARELVCATRPAGVTIHGMAPVRLTERLALRRFTAADAPSLVSLDGDPLVMRFLTGAAKSPAQIRDEVLPGLAGCHLRFPGFGYWAAETRAGLEFIGWFGLRPVTPTDGAMVHWPDARGQTGVAELGYRLRRSAWGQGFGTEGARALVRLAFTELGTQQVVATTMAVNAGSRRVMEKAGLRYLRTVHLDWPDPLDGTEHGDVEYRLLRDEWLASGGAAC